MTDTGRTIFGGGGAAYGQQAVVVGDLVEDPPVDGSYVFGDFSVAPTTTLDPIYSLQTTNDYNAAPRTGLFVPAGLYIFDIYLLNYGETPPLATSTTWYLDWNEGDYYQGPDFFWRSVSGVHRANNLTAMFPSDHTIFWILECVSSGVVTEFKGGLTVTRIGDVTAQEA